MLLLRDYPERVYAGVLGKIIGVYLGRPFEGWPYERIMAELGEIDGYVHERFGQPLVVTDDDITGTFTFLRALPDHDHDPHLTPAQIGRTWLNYLIEGRTILWWGGLGISTEHTAYLRLKAGIEGPRSGSAALNSTVIAEQIGAQIFIDGWAMVCPGDPERAADLARRAASVSHDGAAIHGAQVIAAMEAMAFVESDIERLIDTGLAMIPRDAIIARLIADVREWHAAEPDDWHRTRERIAATYGYDRYPGSCHMVPNHALIIHSLLHGGGDFDTTMRIVTTCGWDADCNAANVGCLLGIRGGLATFDGPTNWRGPVADRLYLPTADGGRAISDALTEAYRIVNLGRALAGEPPVQPKGGARFHFSHPGSVQGFRPEGPSSQVENVAGALAIRVPDLADGPARITTPTFIPPEAIVMPTYELIACPTLYPGQTVRARVVADAGNTAPTPARVVLRRYDGGDALVTHAGPMTTLEPGDAADLTWRVPDLGGQPVAEIGLEIGAVGTLHLDWLTWGGAPDVTLGRPDDGGTMWRRAWVDAVDQFDPFWPEPYRIVSNHGTGLLSQGTDDWEDYAIAVPVTVHLATSAGIAARVSGRRRWYGLILSDDGTARLVKTRGETTTLASVPFAWELRRTCDLALRVIGNRIVGSVDGTVLFDLVDNDRPLRHGGIGLVVADGTAAFDAVTVRPATGT